MCSIAQIFMPSGIKICLILVFRPLCPVLRTTLTTFLNTLRIVRPAYDMIANARQIFHTTPTDQNHRVLLQIVSFTGDVRRDLDPVCQTHTSHLASCRIRFFWCRCVNTHTNAAFLRAMFERRRGRFGHYPLTPFSDQLIDRWHNLPLRPRRLSNLFDTLSSNRLILHNFLRVQNFGRSRLNALIVFEPCSRRDQTSHDHVFFQSPQRIHLA